MLTLKHNQSEIVMGRNFVRNPVSIFWMGMLILGLLGWSNHTVAENEKNTLSSMNDPHYLEVGFFDIHVCNWPDRPLFFLTLFSTVHFDRVKKIEIFFPSGRLLGEIGLKRYRLVQNKGKPDKKVFITHHDLPETKEEGWYESRIHMENGEFFVAYDYVIIEAMQAAQNLEPSNGSEDIEIPKILKWDPVPGASYYQVYIKDVWEGKTILSSKLLAKPFMEMPPKLLKARGRYTWRVHARDVNEHVLLGDFNHGSLTPVVEFSTQDETIGPQPQVE